jgi:hypothetical protein
MDAATTFMIMIFTNVSEPRNERETITMITYLHSASVDKNNAVYINIRADNSRYCVIKLLETTKERNHMDLSLTVSFSKS